MLPEQQHLARAWEVWERIQRRTAQSRFTRELGQLLEPLLSNVPAAGEEEAWGEKLRGVVATVESLSAYAKGQEESLDDPGNTARAVDQPNILLRELSETEVKLVAGLMGAPNRILAYKGPPENCPRWLIAEVGGIPVGAIAMQRDPEGKTLDIRVPWIPPRYKGIGVAAETAAELLARLRVDAELRSICYDPCWLNGHAVVEERKEGNGDEANAG